MEKIINIDFKNKVKINEGIKKKIDDLQLEMSWIIGNAEIIGTDEFGFEIFDPVSEMKCDEIERQIRAEMMKMGYKPEAIYG